LLHLPISTVAPFGMMVRTGLSVEADFLKLVSAVVAMGLAAAQTADRKTTTAADAAIRTTFMAFLSLFPAHGAASPIATSQARVKRSPSCAFKTSRIQDLARELDANPAVVQSLRASV
jgi:hypothetical protein